MYVYHMQSNRDIILTIYSQSHFSHRIDDGEMRYELIIQTRKQFSPKISNENWIFVTYNKLLDSM